MRAASLVAALGVARASKAGLASKRGVSQAAPILCDDLLSVDGSSTAGKASRASSAGGYQAYNLRVQPAYVFSPSQCSCLLSF